MDLFLFSPDSSIIFFRRFACCFAWLVCFDIVCIMIYCLLKNRQGKFDFSLIWFVCIHIIVCVFVCSISRFQFFFISYGMRCDVVIVTLFVIMEVSKNSPWLNAMNGKMIRALKRYLHCIPFYYPTLFIAIFSEIPFSSSLHWIHTIEILRNLWSIFQQKTHVFWKLHHHNSCSFWGGLQRLKQWVFFVRLIVHSLQI